MGRLLARGKNVSPRSTIQPTSPAHAQNLRGVAPSTDLFRLRIESNEVNCEKYVKMASGRDDRSSFPPWSEKAWRSSAQGSIVTDAQFLGDSRSVSTSSTVLPRATWSGFPPFFSPQVTLLSNLRRCPPPGSPGSAHHLQRRIMSSGVSTSPKLHRHDARSLRLDHTYRATLLGPGSSPAPRARPSG